MPSLTAFGVQRLVRNLALLAILVPAAAPAASLDVNTGAACAGTFGLEVTPGSLCLFATETSVDGGGSISGTHGACAFLSVADVQATGTTTLLAGHQIALGEGFSVASGAELTASLNPVISPLAFVADDSPNGEITYRASLQLNLDGLTLDTDDLIRHLIGRSSDGRPWFQVLLKRALLPPENRLVLEALQDDGSSVGTPFGEEVMLPAGCNEISIDWVAAAGAGRLLVSLNGAPFVGLTGLVNGDGRIDRVEWGAVGGQLQSLSGSFAQDDFSSSR